MSEENNNVDKEHSIRLKAQKEFPEFTDSVDRLEATELESNLMRLAKYREETELSKSKDQKLNDTKELLKELNGPYNDTVKALKIKMAYLNVLISEKKG